MRLIKTKKSFRKEFKRQLRYAIAVAVGFMIIYSWRQAIWNSTYVLVEKLTENTKNMASNIATSLIITLVGVLIILISSKLLKDK